MRSGGRKIFAACLALAPLAACGMIDGRDDSRPRERLGVNLPGEGIGASTASDSAYDALPEAPLAPDEPVHLATPMSDERIVVGDSYMIDGKAYTPAPSAGYDEVGYAALLWETADGRHTANGEAYVPGAVSAAHRTLPMPSYVEVTALDTGKTILVRVNDRGPLLNDRIIALSPGAARQLGLAAIDGTAAVRVRKVSPTEQDRLVLRNGGKLAERIETPAGLRAALVKRLPRAPVPLAGPVRTLAVMPPLAAVPPTAETGPGEPIRKVVPVQHSRPTPKPPTQRPVPTQAAARPVPVQPAAPQPAVRRGGYVVQIAAVSSRARADALARSVGGYVMPIGSLFRVRTGPFPTEAAASGSLGQVRAKGYAEARLMANDAR
jgi:rare lipoprotein A